MAYMTAAAQAFERIPNEMMSYYVQSRALRRFDFTEATAITARAVGYIDTPGIWSPEQAAGWKDVTAVHQAGGRIFCQLWHVGRLSHPDFLGGELPVAPSARSLPSAKQRPTKDANRTVQPRAPESRGDVPNACLGISTSCRERTEGWTDGVEIHGAKWLSS